jgi:hypothetical protein
MVRRVFLVPLAAAAALLLTAAPGWAAPKVPHAEGVVVDLGQPCDFPIEVVVKSEQSDLTPENPPRAVLPNGLEVVTGPGVATVTNTDSGKSATYNISGPFKYDPATNRVFVGGNNLISNVVAGTEPFLWLTAGKVSFVLGQPFDAPLRGHVIHDVCAELG